MAALKEFNPNDADITKDNTKLMIRKFKSSEWMEMEDAAILAKPDDDFKVTLAEFKQVMTKQREAKQAAKAPAP